MKVLALKRVPPGDRWVDVQDETKMMDNLTDPLNNIFKREKITDFTIHASDGEVYMLTPEEEPKPVKKYDIYGEV